jgi:DNA-binding MarR family transcriptional regulator
MPSPRDWEALEKVKRASVGQLLLKGARLLDERALARVNRQGLKITLRPAHTSLFPHVDKEGTRLTELARRLGVTKQAAGQLVSDLETLGVLERVDDERDGRAKLVRFTRAGLEALNHGLTVLRGIEDDLEKTLGKAKMRQLHEALLVVVDQLSRPDPDAG